MENLARNCETIELLTEALTYCDAEIVEELTAAGIKAKPCAIDMVHNEVPFMHEGIISGEVDGKEIFIVLTRAWYYWVAKGRVPIDVAERMYADEIGKKDVRVAGHCMKPAPSGWTEVIDYKPYEKGWREGDKFIDTYHIDSQEGLGVFAKFLHADQTKLAIVEKVAPGISIVRS